MSHGRTIVPQVHCVDPMLRSEWVGVQPCGIQRLHGARATLAQFSLPADALASLQAPSPPAVVMLLPHAHVGSQEVLCVCVHAVSAVGGCGLYAAILSRTLLLRRAQALAWVAAFVPAHARFLAVHLPCCGKCAWEPPAWRVLHSLDDVGIASPKRTVRALEVAARTPCVWDDDVQRESNKEVVRAQRAPTRALDAPLDAGLRARQGGGLGGDSDRSERKLQQSPPRAASGAE